MATINGITICVCQIKVKNIAIFKHQNILFSVTVLEETPV